MNKRALIFVLITLLLMSVGVGSAEIINVTVVAVAVLGYIGLAVLSGIAGALNV